MEWVTGLFAGLGAYFVFGTVWFFIIGAVLFSWLVFLTEKESHFFASVIVLAFIWLTTSANGFSIVDNPLTALKWLGIYFAAGTAWSFVKWFQFLFKKRDELKTLKDRYVGKFGVALDANGKLPPQDMDDFIKFLNDQRYTTAENYGSIKTPQDIVPSVAGRISDLTRWIVWWPFSLTWAICNDLFRKLGRAIVRVCEGAYAKLANSVFSSEI